MCFNILDYLVTFVKLNFTNVKDINQRISTVIEHFELSNSEFADEVEVQRSSISHIVSGRNKPSLDFLIKVKERFPELTWDWLIKGEGEMLAKTPEKEENTEEKPTSTLPDLFSMIDDENFGITESEDRVLTEKPSESLLPTPSKEESKISDSQRLEVKEIEKTIQNTDNQQNKIKRIVLFYENGKFESFEP